MPLQNDDYLSRPQCASNILWLSMISKVAHWVFQIFLGHWRFQISLCGLDAPIQRAEKMWQNISALGELLNYPGVPWHLSEEDVSCLEINPKWFPIRKLSCAALKWRTEYCKYMQHIEAGWCIYGFVNWVIIGSNDWWVPKLTHWSLGNFN